MYRTVIIGASGEIGAAMVQAALARGDVVAALDLVGPEQGGCAHTGSIDITSLANVREALGRCRDALGGIDVLINAAGIMTKGALHETTDADFARVLDVNLSGAFRLTQTAADLMGADGGAILHTSSIHALRGAQNRIAYAASKGGITALVQAAASELGPLGITINAVAPGPVGRGMGSQPEDRRRAISRVPLMRVAEAAEVAAAAMFLTSAGGRFITGHVLPVDGGAGATFFAGPTAAMSLVE
ncbi:SDR family NAD(P)-dependent oxidoreductase [Sulfitobacter guttiformis]|uniref:3-oxoacyl-[acyl-carrier protein] reductase n=1 Tax=Sulfitobacter guttiformis TaxID=74349 RepID=A0A420DT62_9RHOB|nr:SDR family oxidoreductase [Sulfitobacter guttiformis]KIN71037.1 Short-chain dehydrogenase/reductase SDR [Sulfitobacter guttiformis KCTC 32187]RKE97521.1 3-oxoacyl-[acyl-carrier protein] reductase [Sulfitobacter guttiformis]